MMNGLRVVKLFGRLLFVMAVLGVCVQTRAATLYVDLNNQGAVPPYDSWATAATDIQTAISAAPAGDIVLVTNGTYALSSTINIGKDVTLLSVNGPEKTVVDAGGNQRCFLLTSRCTISGFSIVNGYAASAPPNDSGGGVYCEQMGDTYEAVATNCFFIGNIAGYSGGGGMYGGVAKNCTFVNNVGERGGGMVNGIANNCSFFCNEATDGGGGMSYCSANNCTLSGNKSPRGGGMYSGTAQNSILWNNQGGEIYGTSCFNTCSPELTHGVDGNITNAPLLASSSHLATGSPCIGAGSSNYVSGLDIDGAVWLVPPSMGCDEFGGATGGTLEVSISGTEAVADKFEGGWLVGVLGAASGSTIDFGDGHVVSNIVGYVLKSYDNPGQKTITVKAWNSEFPAGVSTSMVVQVYSAVDSSIYVSTATGDDVNDGRSWSAAKKTIQGGVDVQLVHGGTVLVAEGSYILGSTIDIDLPMIVESTNGPSATIIDGNGSVGCLDLGNTASIISGFTITDGNSYKGGGVYCQGEVPVVTNCILMANWADNRGGGMYQGVANDCLFDSNVSDYIGGGKDGGIVNNCTFTNNSVDNGYEGGGGMRGGTANYSTFISNSAGVAGGGLSGGNANHCLFIGNRTSDRGGAMNGGTANYCTFEGNSTRVWGGGMNGGTANNCIFTGNSVTYNGGAMFDGVANNCTIVDNSAGSNGGGIWKGTANNSIIRNNTNGDTYESICNYTCSPGLTHGVDGNITNAPMFVDEANGDYRLVEGSPCIDAGFNGYVSTSFDLNGYPRILNGTVDMGAYELIMGDPDRDSDSDGMRDIWEQKIIYADSGDSITNIYGVLPDDDFDGDFLSNFEEYQWGSDPCDLDSDGDGVNDGVEVSSFGTSPTDPDTDGDGLSDLEEIVLYPTDPTDADSDNDGWLDGEEIANGTSPLGFTDGDDGDGMPNAWEYGYFNTVYYGDGDNYDSDPFSNLAEYIAGTDPADPYSYFLIGNAMTEVEGTNRFVVGWNSITGRYYNVQWTTNLTSGFQSLEGASNLEHPQSNYTNTTHNAESAGYYKVEVRLK